jgi:hypothetical protein
MRAVSKQEAAAAVYGTIVMHAGEGMATGSPTGASRPEAASIRNTATFTLSRKACS